MLAHGPVAVYAWRTFGSPYRPESATSGYPLYTRLGVRRDLYYLRVLNAAISPYDSIPFHRGKAIKAHPFRDIDSIVPVGSDGRQNYMPPVGTHRVISFDS